ncbi:hypothetical protein [uncultured Dokdonia sp.]|uniref:hypothetical protein n=1 Tax=uncultured Dokdonia sp. TaxID=575653 RepID=UPI002603051F|nr:hypothetical protein [uncultured Dokdonia sp.]
MGYELNIRREDDVNKISKNEWLVYLQSDSQFLQIEEFSTEMNNGESFTISTPNAGLWEFEKFSVPFTFSEKYGEITVKNPDEKIITKMIEVARSLDAFIEGEEGEIYDEESLKEMFPDTTRSNPLLKDKKWWKFWQ